MNLDWNTADDVVVPFERSFLLYRVYGLLRADPEGLRLEFQTLENVLGIFRSRVRVLEIPWQELVSCHLIPHPLRRPELRIQTRHLKPLQQMPGSLQGQYSCRIRHRDRELAEQLVLQVELALSEARLQALENPRPELPPPGPPLSRLLLKAAADRLRDLLR